MNKEVGLAATREAWRKAMWTNDRTERKPETEVERLIREADELDRQAEHMKGCSWMGDEPPWAHLQREAGDKRRLAGLLGMLNHRPAEGG